MVSEDIVAARDEYVAIMSDHGKKDPDAIVASLRETQNELQAVFRSANADQAQREPAPGEWNLLELARHAEFTERLIAKLVHHLARSGTPTAEDFEGAGIGMMPKDDTRDYAQVLDDLARRNEDLLNAVRALPQAPDCEMKLPHPFFGPLNCLEWAGFQRVHDLDHIQHARKIIAAISA
jgi:hypothetical protein